MDSFFKMVDVQTVLFIYMAVGFGCRKAGIFNDVARDKLTDFVVFVTLPCMIFESFNMAFSLESLKQGALALLIAVGMSCVALLLGKVLYNRFPYEEKSILQYGTLVSNSGFAGLPVVSGAYGDEGLFLGSLFIIPTRILMWSAGISLFTRADAKQAVKKVLLNPGIIAVEVGLVRMLFQIPLPHFVDTAVDNLGGCTSPMAMALVGAILVDVPLKTVFDLKSFYLVAVRQFLLPGICLAALRLLHVDPLTIGVSVVITGMPIGSTTAILAQKYVADAKFASKCVFISTLTSLVTVPILTLFL
ncbi:MAG: AEC family transporter [Flintibacter sp.]|jgi:predicted permease|uniref:AEC family transporter n=1 Tax=Flintibacter sp. TaxID=1918624 RepID=UPI002672C66D|nr:AEC family transporter [Flintibacter sp.]MDD7115947.1 AEC family transporter [Flintibacter sp.]